MFYYSLPFCHVAHLQYMSASDTFQFFGILINSLMASTTRWLEFDGDSDAGIFF